MAERLAATDLRLRKPVVLVGMMGAGKTAVGRAVAQALRVPFVDSDAEIEAAANMTIAEIFERDGEPFFRQKEAQVIARLLSGPPGILSTGGGAFLQPENREAIARRGVSVWLEADLDLLWARVKMKPTRPLLKTADPFGTLSDLLARRNPVYAQADLRVTTRPGYTIDDTSRRVLAALATRPDVMEPPR
ncbi:Shikimate kinase 1 [Roseivivax jejudonensis]|uniref:Shikimate kinase n=1 Tax=Roseivivax jejudonensis TaxID=1529041 RepID=A0A1X6YUI9_9RHOB|nr:shikimate kinase [Roseivivax jejudonensis]SLN31596.1 Shikimate kinase 1 [Roseivivax jejudonensis]